MYHQALEEATSWSSEHGPWSGSGAAADLELLARASGAVLTGPGTFGGLARSRAKDRGVAVADWRAGGGCVVETPSLSGSG